MKKSMILFLVFVLSALLSACNGEVLVSNQEAAGNPIDPAEQSVAMSTGPKASMVNVFDSANMAAIKPIRQIVIAEYGIMLDGFQDPGTLEGALLLFPASLQIAASDGVGFSPAKIVAVVMIGTATYFLCLNTVKFASQAVGEISLPDFRLMWAKSKISDEVAVSLLSSLLTPTIGENVFASTRHYESQAVINGMNAYAKDGKLRKQGDGKSSGSIRIFAGIQPGRKLVNIAVLMVVSQQVNFVVLQADVFSNSVIPDGGTDLGEDYYFVSQTAKIICAWTMTKTIGHGQKDPSEFLTVGQGWQYWATMQTKYGLYTELAEIQLP